MKYTIRVQTGQSRFSVPSSVVRSLGLRKGEPIIVRIFDDRGRKLHHGKILTRLRSGYEIYGPEITAVVKPRQIIQVECFPTLKGVRSLKPVTP